MLGVCGILCTKIYLMNVRFSQAPSQHSSFDLPSFEFLHLCFVSKELSLFAGLEAVFAETFYHVLVALPTPRHTGQPGVRGFAQVGALKRAAGTLGFSLAACACLPASLLPTVLNTSGRKRQH